MSRIVTQNVPGGQRERALVDISSLGDVVPASDDAQDIGSASLRFSEIRSRVVVAVATSGAGVATVAAGVGGMVAGTSKGPGTTELIMGGGPFPPALLSGVATTLTALHVARCRNVGGGATLIGSAYVGGADSLKTALLETGINAYGCLAGGYAFTQGAAGSVSQISAYGPGSFLWAYCAQSAGNTHLATTTANAKGAFCTGRLQGNGPHTLRANASGSFVQGLLSGTGSGIIESTGSADGSFTQGLSLTGGVIRSSGGGAFAQGRASASTIVASGTGALARGNASGGNAITASGDSSMAMGASASGAITASALNASQLGPGVNAEADTLSMGTRVRIKGTTGAPGTPRDGDIYVDGAGDVVLRSGGVNITLNQSSAYTPTNVTPDRAYDANATTISELADVLGTLIADLQSTGLLA